MNVSFCGIEPKGTAIYRDMHSIDRKEVESTVKRLKKESSSLPNSHVFYHTDLNSENVAIKFFVADGEEGKLLNLIQKASRSPLLKGILRINELGCKDGLKKAYASTIQMMLERIPH